MSGRPALAVDGAGDPLWLTPAASAMLERLFAGWSCASGQLPDRSSPRCAGCRPAPPRPRARQRRRRGSHAGSRPAAQHVADQWLFRLAERHEGEDKATARRAHGLTSREAEVLLWISRGKQNREVSAILEISPRTVKQASRTDFREDGRRNRASATAIAVAHTDTVARGRLRMNQSPTPSARAATIRAELARGDADTAFATATRWRVRRAHAAEAHFLAGIAPPCWAR